MPIDTLVQSNTLAPSELVSFGSPAPGVVTGKVVVPVSADGVIVRYRKQLSPVYAADDYVQADESQAFTDQLNRNVMPFEIEGLKPGVAYALTAYVVSTVLGQISRPSPEFLVVVAGAPFVRRTYLPPEVLHFTEFPRHDGKDLQMQVRLIEDQFKRMATRIQYRNIRSAPTPAVDGEGMHDPNILTGEVGTTRFDPLWGEEVPESVAQGETWKQPHGKDELSVDRKRVFEEPVELPAIIRREAKRRELLRWGFDEVRDVLCIIPVSFLDRYGVFVEAGDEFHWDGENYTVLQRRRDAWFYNTTARLFVIANCEQKRSGS